MPAAIPIAMVAASAISAYGANKAAKAAKLDPATQAMQDEALQQQQARSRMFNPMVQMLATQAQNRLPQSARGGGMQAPSIGQMQSPYAGAAMTQLARGLPGPQRRLRYQ